MRINLIEQSSQLADSGLVGQPVDLVALERIGQRLIEVRLGVALCGERYERRSSGAACGTRGELAGAGRPAGRGESATGAQC